MYEGQNIHMSPLDGKRLCSFSQKVCKQRRLKGFGFCVRHILEDITAPFKQCQYEVKPNEQCINSVPIQQERMYCLSHLQKLGLASRKSAIVSKKPLNKEDSTFSKLKPLDGSEANKINISLKHKRQKQLKKWKTKESFSKREAIPKCTLKAQNAHFRYTQWYKNIESPELLAYLEDGFPNITTSYCTKSPPDSRDQSLPLYTNQFLENPTTGMDVFEKANIQLVQLRSDLQCKEEQLSYAKLSLLIEAVQSDVVGLANVLNNEKSNHPSQIFVDRSTRQTVHITCALTTDDRRCTRKALPYTKFCLQHIRHDGEQNLFTRCVDKHPDRKKCPGSKLNIFQSVKLIPKKRSYNKKSKVKLKKSKVPSRNSKSEARTLSTSSTSSEDDDDTLSPEDALFASLPFTAGRLEDDEGLFHCDNIEEDDDLLDCGLSFEACNTMRELSSPTLNQLSTAADATLNTLVTNQLFGRKQTIEAFPSNKLTKLVDNGVNSDKDFENGSSYVNENQIAGGEEFDISDKNAPLEKVNPDIFFSTVFPLSKS